MYRCEVCGFCVPPKNPKLVHRVLRADGSILRELAVCKRHHDEMGPASRNYLAPVPANGSLTLTKGAK